MGRPKATAMFQSILSDYEKLRKSMSNKEAYAVLAQKYCYGADYMAEVVYKQRKRNKQGDTK